MDLTMKKDQFWEELSDAVEQPKGKLIIAGDFNERVGISDGINYTETWREYEE